MDIPVEFKDASIVLPGLTFVKHGFLTFRQRHARSSRHPQLGQCPLAGGFSYVVCDLGDVWHPAAVKTITTTKRTLQ